MISWKKGSFTGFSISYYESLSIVEWIYQVWYTLFTMAKIKSIEAFNSKKDSAFKGENIGITLSNDSNLEVGMIICENKNLPRIIREFKAKLFWMKNKELSINDDLILKCSTQEVKCKISKIQKKIDSSSLDIIEENSNNLKETEVGEVIIKTDKDLVIENFNDIPELGRFVIKRDSDIVGAGVISNH